MRNRIALIALGALALSAFFVLPKAAARAEQRAELFLPGSYEEYLNLSNASDFAESETYLAVADGSSLFVFDKGAGRYSRYEHQPGNDPCNISKLSFTSDGELFFSDQNAHLYHFDFSSMRAQIQNNLPCATFTISGNYLYTTAVVSSMTTFYAVPYFGGGALGDYSSMKRIAQLTSSSNTTPSMFVYRGALHCAVNNRVYVYTDQDGEYVPSEQLFSHSDPVESLSSVAVVGGEVYYSINGSYQNEKDGLYRADFEKDSVRLTEEQGIVSLSSKGDNLYLIAKNSVREFKKSESGELEATGFEIGAASSSYNRLSNATDTVRAGSLVVAADPGNARVLVYDVDEKSYTLFPLEGVSHVATDGKIVAASSGRNISLYQKGEREPFYVHEASEEVQGLALVYENCYYITDESFGKAEQGEKEVSRSSAPSAIASDLYGNLYVADASNTIRKYREEEFLSSDSFGEEATVNWSLPSSYHSLRADYEGNLYYLSGNGIWKNGMRLGDIPGIGIVYGKSTYPVSFALGFEDNGLYLQFGDYMAYSTALNVSNLSQIQTEEVYPFLQNVPKREELSYFDVPAGATGVEIDLNLLKEDSAYFSYLGYERVQAGRGLFLGKIEKFTLLAFYSDYSYRVMLFSTELLSPVLLEKDESAESYRYITNEIAFQRFPCLIPALSIGRLERLCRVKLLSSISAGDFSYGFIETAKGERGYVPLSYLTSNVPFEDDPASYSIGYLKASADGVTFRSDDGTTLTVKDRKQVRIYDGGDGRYFVRFEENGLDFTAQVTANMIESGNPNALRMSVIVILCVILVGILAAYVLFVPKRKKKQDSSLQE